MATRVRDSESRKSFLSPSRLVDIMLMRFTKQERWEGAGTSGFPVTLKKHERCEKYSRRTARIELAHRL
jgi:hypothetical protein